MYQGIADRPSASHGLCQASSWRWRCASGLASTLHHGGALVAARDDADTASSTAEFEDMRDARYSALL